ncbi:hypothetical protein ACMYSQ_001107 [Aspergillus niger]
MSSIMMEMWKGFRLLWPAAVSRLGTQVINFNVLKFKEKAAERAVPTEWNVAPPMPGSSLDGP